MNTPSQVESLIFLSENGFKDVISDKIVTINIDESLTIHGKYHLESTTMEITTLNNIFKYRYCEDSRCFSLKFLNLDAWQDYIKLYQNLYLEFNLNYFSQYNPKTIPALFLDRIMEKKSTFSINDYNLKLPIGYLKNVEEYVKDLYANKINQIKSHLHAENQNNFHRASVSLFFLLHESGPFSDLIELTKNIKISSSSKNVSINLIKNYSDIDKIEKNISTIIPTDISSLENLKFLEPLNSFNDLISLWRDVIGKLIKNFRDNSDLISNQYLSCDDMVYFKVPNTLIDRFTLDNIDEVDLDIVKSYPVGKGAFARLPYYLAKYLNVKYQGGSFNDDFLLTKSTGAEGDLFISIMESLSGQEGIYSDLNTLYTASYNLAGLGLT